VIIRSERQADMAAIRHLNELVFGGPVEGSIVETLRAACPGVVSLVAVEEGRVVGHIFFSPVEVAGLAGIEAMGLGPMAVAPDRQRQGVGSALIARSLEELGRRGCALVVVLGHAEYYPKFGFVPASGYGLRSQWDGVPDDVFMARILKADRARSASGVVRYRKEFDIAV
jgi:putative acetyltransferase